MAMKFRSTTFTSQQLQREQARRIYERFLSARAPDEVRRNCNPKRLSYEHMSYPGPLPGNQPLSMTNATVPTAVETLC